MPRMPRIYPLPRPVSPQALSLPENPLGINQMGQPRPTEPGRVPFNQMPAFQGFPGPFPDDPVDPNLTPHERMMARLEKSLPAHVFERLQHTLNGTTPPATTPPATTPPATTPTPTTPTTGTRTPISTPRQDDRGK